MRTNTIETLVNMAVGHRAMHVLWMLYAKWCTSLHQNSAVHHGCKSETSTENIFVSVWAERRKADVPKARYTCMNKNSLTLSGTLVTICDRNPILISFSVPQRVKTYFVNMDTINSKTKSRASKWTVSLKNALEKR